MSESLSFSQFNSLFVSGIVFHWFSLYVYVCLTDTTLVCQSSRESVSTAESLPVQQRVYQSIRELTNPPESLSSTRESVCPPDSFSVHQRVCQSTRESVSPPECLSVHQRVCQSSRESTNLPENLTIHQRVCLSTREFVCPPESLSVHKRVYLSTRESVCPSESLSAPPNSLLVRNLFSSCQSVNLTTNYSVSQFCTICHAV